MEIYTPSRLETALKWLGRTNLPGVHKFINRYAPRHATSAYALTNLFELEYYSDISDIVDMSIFYFGSYCPEELTLLRDAATVIRTIKAQVNFFDLGANCGQHSLFMASQVTTTHSFEPSEPICKRFERNVALNGINNITLHQIALGDNDTEIGLGSGFPGNSGSRSLLWSLPGRSLEMVQVRNAETYFRDHDLPSIDLMKLDCEGYEKIILCSLKERLKRDRPVIMMEFIRGAGFVDLLELQSNLYPDHVLKSLVPRRSGYELKGFDWEIETLVVMPSELAPILELRGRV